MSAKRFANTESALEAPADVPAAMARLERQLERGSLYAHTALGYGAERLAEVESFAYGLIDTLVQKGLISTDELGESIKNVRTHIEGERRDAPENTVIRLEPDESTSAPVQVDCASRLHICKAVCCKLEFALSTAEVEAGRIKWDLGRPYLIRHEEDGHCTHFDRDTGRCGVYQSRPSVCRNYSCANDQRIWKNFEEMELNHDWIDQHVKPTAPRALKVLVTQVSPER